MKRITIALVALLVLTVAVAPAAAAPADGVDECKNSDKGPGDDGGPPSIVSDVTPDFLSDLMGSLPVPGFVKSAFGASGC